MKPDDPRLKTLKLRPPTPREYAGQWIAWNEDHTRIIANGKDLAEVEQAALAAGCDDPIFEKALPADAYFVGGA
jgi:hypothetical protein